MIRRLIHLLRDKRGGGVLEFALVAPAFIFLVNGIAQLGIIFYANAGLNNALAEGARAATVFRGETDAELEIRSRAKITAIRWGLKNEELTIPAFVYDSDATNGSPYVLITMTYDVTPNFIFMEMDEITLRQSRRAYLYPVGSMTPGGS